MIVKQNLALVESCKPRRVVSYKGGERMKIVKGILSIVGIVVFAILIGYVVHIGAMI